MNKRESSIGGLKSPKVNLAAPSTQGLFNPTFDPSIEVLGPDLALEQKFIPVTQKAVQKETWDYITFQSQEEIFGMNLNQRNSSDQEVQNGQNNAYFPWLTRQEKLFIFFGLTLWFIFLYSRKS